MRPNQCMTSNLYGISMRPNPSPTIRNLSGAKPVRYVKQFLWSPISYNIVNGRYTPRAKSCLVFVSSNLKSYSDSASSAPALLIWSISPTSAHIQFVSVFESNWTWDEGAAGCGKLRNEELYNPYSHPYIIRVSRSTWIRRVGYIACTKDTSNVYNGLVGRP